MKGFNIEKNLNHQSQAVEITVALFESPDNIQLVNYVFERSCFAYIHLM
jgi:hypothetical protein